MLTLLELRGVPALLPTMTPLGPLMVAQYVYWRRRRGPERTTREYLQVEPLAQAEPHTARTAHRPHQGQSDNTIGA